MKGHITEYGDTYVKIIVPTEQMYDFDRKQITDCDVHFWDGRSISPDQRKKTYAILNDISVFKGMVQILHVIPNRR